MSSNITAQEARIMQRSMLLAQYRQRNTGQAQNLEAPIVPEALQPDNLLPVEVLDKGLLVQIRKWNRVLENDVLEVTWDNDVVYTYKVNSEDEKFPHELTLSTDYLTKDGLYQLSYMVTAESGIASESNPTLVTIDLHPPHHGNVPEPLIFPKEVMSEGLTSEYLSEHNDQVMATVPGYRGMTAGEVVHPYWDNFVLDAVTITSEDVSKATVPVVISGTTVRSAGEGTKCVDYFLTSRAGFDGPYSEPSLVDVVLTPTPANLLAPRVPLAADGVIDLDDASAGVIIEIDQYEHANTGDLVAAKWGASNLSSATVIAGSFPLLVPVPRKVVINEGSGDKTVSYQVLRGNHQYNAPQLNVNVDIDAAGPVDPDPSTPENEALVAPTVLGGKSESENELAPEDRDENATVVIPFYAEAKVDEVIKLYWGYPEEAKLVEEYTVIQDDIDNGEFPDFTVPQSVVESTPNNPTWPVYYTLSRSKLPLNAVLSPTRDVNVHLVGPGGVDGLAEAEFPDASANGWLLAAQVEDGANVFVPVYENMAVGDQVKLDWVAFSTTNTATDTEIEGTGYTESKTIGDAELLNGVNFAIPYEESIEPIAGAAATAQGAGQVQYTVTQGGDAYSSPKANVKIDLGHP